MLSRLQSFPLPSMCCSLAQLSLGAQLQPAGACLVAAHQLIMPDSCIGASQIIHMAMCAVPATHEI